MGTIPCKDKENPTDLTISNPPPTHGFRSDANKAWHDYYFIDHPLAIERQFDVGYADQIPFFT